MQAARESAGEGDRDASPPRTLQSVSAWRQADELGPVECRDRWNTEIAPGSHREQARRHGPIAVDDLERARTAQRPDELSCLQYRLKAGRTGGAAEIVNRRAQ